MKEQEPMTEVIQIYSAMLPEMTVTPEVVVKTDWKGILLSASSYMYWGVMALLFVRFFIQLSSILLLAYRSRLLYTAYQSTGWISLPDLFHSSK